MKDLAEERYLLRELSDDDGHLDAVSRLLVEHGVSFDPAPLPADVEDGEESCCFYNAFVLAESRPERFVYWEGVATFRSPIGQRSRRCWPPHAHAWCVERGVDIVDPTWIESRNLQPLAYRGIAVPPALVAPYATKRCSSPLSRYSGRIDVVYRALGLTAPTASARYSS